MKPEGLLGNIKITNVFHHPVQALIFTFYFINEIYNIIFHPAPLVTLIKWNIVFVKEMLEQPGSETRVHSLVTLRELRHTNIYKQSKLLGDVDVHLESRSISHDISMFCIEKCKQLEMLDSCKATTLRMLKFDFNIHPC